jgi:hypothetical protein
MDLVASESGVFLPPSSVSHAQKPVWSSITGSTLQTVKQQCVVGSVQLYSGHRSVHMCTISLYKLGVKEIGFKNKLRIQTRWRKLLSCIWM